MNRHLRNFAKEGRLRRGLNPQQLAAELGYRNVNRGASRVLRFEQEGFIDEHLFAKLARVLALDPSRVGELRTRDRAEELAEWERWVRQPVPMELIVRLMPGVHVIRPLPAGTETPGQAMVYARQLAIRDRRPTCLVLSRRESVWIDERGHWWRSEAAPGRPNAPYMTIGNAKETFLLRTEVLLVPDDTR